MKPSFDLGALLANPRLVVAAAIPLLAPVFIPLTDAPVHWRFAAMPAAVVLLVVIGALVVQRSMDKPAKLWRARPWRTFVVDVLLMVVAAFGVFYSLRPWEPQFEVEQVLLLNAGFGVAGIVIAVSRIPIWVAQARGNKGPLKKIRETAVVGMAILRALLFGPMFGYLASLPLGFLYLEEVASGGPASLGREAWLLVLTLSLAVPTAVIWAYIDLRKRLAKQR